jgi:hypothetical protein
MEDPQILDANIEQRSLPRRRSLLPTWIKVFCWIFLIWSAFVPIGVISAIIGYQFQISIFGLSTNDPTTALGIALMAVFALKGVAALGLWTEKEWAITVAQADAVIGILICVFMMLVYPFIREDGFNFSLRLELALLIPYLLKLNAIKCDWLAAQER